MPVTERKRIFDMTINEYVFNIVVSVIAGAIAGALIGFIVCANVIPNESPILNEKKENNHE